MFPKDLRCEYLTNPLGLDVLAPRLSWLLDPGDDDPNDLRQVAYQIIVASSPEKFNAAHADLWDSGKIESPETTQIVYGGEPLKSRAWCFWKVKVWSNHGGESSFQECKTAFWHVGLLSKEDWNATWIGAPAGEPRTIQVTDTTRPAPVEIIASNPSPLLRKQFQLPAKPRRAILYVTSLGEYEMRLNGERIGDHLLAPEWTDFTKRLQYQAYDITANVKEGDNVLGAVLGDGWYLGLLGPGDKIRQRYYGSNRRLLAKLVVEMTDGSMIEVASDDSWKVFENGPVQSADHLIGETYDARLEQPGWDTPCFDDSGWSPAIVDESVEVNIVAQKNEPVRVFETLKPIAITEPSPGTYVFDLGQNMVGWCEIHLDGDVGQSITLRHGEILDLDGNLYVDNLRLANQKETFILDGSGSRWYHPHFTFHGFQYVEVTGLTTAPSLDDLVGKAFCSGMRITGTFECSNPLLNKLWNNILWTQRDNMASIPTDCPQRNERMGWMGDAQVFAQNAIFNLDMAAFYSKFTVDMRDGQAEEGMYPDFAPHPFPPFSSSFGPAWGDCGVIIPWRVYVAYGDTRLLEEHYDSMKQYIELIYDENPDYIWNHMGSNYGDWLNGDTLKAEGYPSKGGEIPKVAFATAFYALSAGLVAKMAAVLGKDDDARMYAEMASKVRAAFNEKFVNQDDGTIEGDTQAGYAIALGFDLLPDDKQGQAVEHLMSAIEKYDGRLSTGFISTIQMMLELSKRGHNDQAYAFAESTRFPSWGYTIENGATTIWERWDGFVAGRGFQDKGMNSFNHYSIGAIGEWFYRVVLGINFDEQEPGMKHVILAPLPGGTLDWAKGYYESIRGRISSSWIKTGIAITYTFELPPNVRATIDVPAGSIGTVEVNGKMPNEEPGIELVKNEGGHLVFQAGSGNFKIMVS